jgi:hypothetical protein
MKSKEIKYEVLFNKRKLMVMYLNKEDIRDNYLKYTIAKKAFGYKKYLNLRNFVLAEIQHLISTTFLDR